MRLVFTSCMDAERVPRQPVWDAVRALQPDALFLLGDAIYMDWGLASTARVPAWRRRYDRAPGATLAAFRADMHRRYRRQWGVAEFRALVRDLVARVGPERLYVCRDEHDFAWNNAVGAGPADAPRHVPAPLAAVSDALFAQFRAVLARPGDWADGYPGPEQALPPAPAPAAELGPLRVLLLDERSARTGFGPGVATPRILDDSAREALLGALAAPGTGPLLVAGSSPLRHDYRFSDQGWSTDAGAVAEYRQLLDGARQAGRAVLYVGGDIHRLAYGGPVEPGSPVVQLLASGAAVGRILFKRFVPSFATVEVSTEGGGGRLTIGGRRGDEALTPIRLPFAAGQWSATPPAGESTALAVDAWGPAEERLERAGPLGVLTLRQGAAQAAAPQLELPAHALDALYGDGFVAADWPQALAVEALAERPALRVARAGAGAAGVEAVLRAAFHRAGAAGRGAVVLFVHGFQKTFAESIEQACRLRELHQVEPVLWSWPSGEDAGFLSALQDFVTMQQRCARMQSALSGTLALFGDLAAQHPGCRATVLARSMGALALDAVLQRHDLMLNLAPRLAPLAGVLLSAPLLPQRHHAEGLARLGCPAWVTFNRQDRSLRAADWLSHGELLGNAGPGVERAPNARYLDWTAVPGVDGGHDHLTLPMGAAADALNAALLHGTAPTPAQLAAAGVVAA
ncbi:alpha/beta hydrolase [Piscinibacter sakaiensis]|uniref:PhoD-like phosphatase metallophosphatase domain-containing protein n=1 Tax=Piscinibacter sakaiensis TaxID=1547922 RepID=A0A0K8P2S0_PISS1|nr:alpha/beta hydrolase [Piscinibacter sakaiensis]GAP36829.1 hypothetical protein ISF6_2669 [Piscinibacter sakaiensis]